MENMNINWQEIKDIYPKAFDLFCNKYIDINIPDIYVSYSENTEDYIVYAEEQLCFCDILKFFEDSVGIIINCIFGISGYIGWNYKIIEKNTAILIYDYYEDNKELLLSNRIINNIEKAQNASAIKAFEILNTMIEKGEIK